MSASTDTRDTPPAPRHQHQVLAVLLLACVSFALSQTLVIPALPAIASSLSASPESTSWVLTGFLLAASVATPIIGKLGDLYGRGRMLTVVLALFALGGAINALAPSIGWLIAGRVLQGVAGGVFPLSFGIVRETSPVGKVPTHLALLSGVFGIGGGIGLPLSGVIVDNADIAWLFWLSLIAAPAALAAYWLIPSTLSDAPARVDWLGALVLSAALASILLGVTHAEGWGWTDPRTLALLIGGLVLVAVWVSVERRVEHPLIELDVLRNRAVAATNATGFLVGVAMFASFLLIPQYAQTPTSSGYGFGYSVTMSGLLLLPSALVQLAAGPLAGVIGIRIGFRRVLVLGATSLTAAFALLGVVHSEPWHFIASGVLLGIGITFAFASMANLVVAASPRDQIGIATGINTVVRTVGGSFGAATATAILAAHTPAGSLLPSGNAYGLAFWFSAVVALVAVGLALLVPEDVDERADEPVSVPAAAAVAD